MSVIPHVRICAGGCRQRRSLPQTSRTEKMSSANSRLASPSSDVRTHDRILTFRITATLSDLAHIRLRIQGFAIRNA